MSEVNLVLNAGRKNYMRFTNDSAELIKDKLSKYYSHNIEDSKNINVAICSSGMNALSSTVNVIMSRWGWSNDTCIIYGDEMYCDTPRLVKYHSKFYTGNGLRTYKVTVQNSENVKELFRRECRNRRVLFIIEPCTNPNGNLFDFNIVKDLRDLCKQMVLVADTTWTPDMQVLDMGADVIAISLTKHHSGSTCILGAVISRDSGIAEEVNDYNRISGFHISPYDCRKLLEMIDTMDERIEKASKTAIIVGKELEKKPWVDKVMLPTLESHPSFELGEIYGIRPTVFNILMEIPLERNKVEEWLRNRVGIEFATSYGNKNTRIDPWFKHYKKTSWYWVRLSIGYESNAREIIDSLSAM